MTPFTNFEMLRLVKRDNTVIPLEHDDVTAIIFKALHASGTNDRLMALNLADKVIYRLKSWKGTSEPVHSTDLDCMIKFALAESGNLEAAQFVANDNIRVN